MSSRSVEFFRTHGAHSHVKSLIFVCRSSRASVNGGTNSVAGWSRRCQRLGELEEENKKDRRVDTATGITTLDRSDPVIFRHLHIKLTHNAPGIISGRGPVTRSLSVVHEQREDRADGRAGRSRCDERADTIDVSETARLADFCGADLSARRPKDV